MAEISPTELSDRLQDGDDERGRPRPRYTPPRRVRGVARSGQRQHRHLRRTDRRSGDGERRPRGSLPADREIVTVCTAGIVSQTAAEVLREMGYDASTLTDGMNGWSRVHPRARPDRPRGGRSFRSLVREGGLFARADFGRRGRGVRSLPLPRSTRRSSTPTTPNSSASSTRTPTPTTSPAVRTSPTDTTFRTSSIRRTRSRSTRPRSKTANRSRLVGRR